jgi:zinc/manganese transport system permease protein
MFDAISLGFMAQALVICLVLTGIHGYLGIHVLERKVIFVDLAMGQIAALGATFALALGYETETDPATVYFLSLAFTLAGAAIFSMSRMRYERIPQEAVIGIVYATASSIAILILAKSTFAGEHIKGMLVGNILLVTWPDIFKTAAIYLVIGVFHWIFRDRFLRISIDPEGAFQSGIRVRLWDFLFYATFGIVITSSVAIAGVLLVFSFLVVPAAVGVLLAERVAVRILVAWGVGTAVSVLGILFTFWEGTIPAGPAIVTTFASTLLVVGLYHFVRHAASKGRALAQVTAGGIVVAALVVTSFALRKPEEHHDEGPDAEWTHTLEELRSQDEAKALHAIDHLRLHPDPRALPEVRSVLRKTESGRVIVHAAKALAAWKDAEAVPALKAALERKTLDASLRRTVAETLLTLKDPAGLAALVEIVGDGSAPRLAREKALRQIESATGQSFGEAFGSDPAPLKRLGQWWEERKERIRWNETSKQFE